MEISNINKYGCGFCGKIEDILHTRKIKDSNNKNDTTVPACKNCYINMRSWLIMNNIKILKE